MTTTGLTLSFDWDTYTWQPSSHPESITDMMLGVNFDVLIEVGDEPCGRLPDIPVVELRFLLKQWLASGACKDFSYVSFEEEDEGIVKFNVNADGRWSIGSVWIGADASQTVSTEALTSACALFIERVDEWVRVARGVEIDDVLSPKGWWVEE